jgi:hypothetical protein
MARFQLGHSGGPGRPPGVKNMLQADFLRKLAKDFAEFGEQVIRIARMEKPVEYLKVIASVLPKEFIFADNTLADLSDEELAELMAFVRNVKAEKQDDKPDATALH